MKRKQWGRDRARCSLECSRWATLEYWRAPHSGLCWLWVLEVSKGDVQWTDAFHQWYMRQILNIWWHDFDQICSCLLHNWTTFIVLYCQVTMGRWLIPMGKQTWTTYSLSPRWSSKEEPPVMTAFQLTQEYHWWPELPWHRAAGGKRCSSESIFLEPAGFPQHHALTVVHADIRVPTLLLTKNSRTFQDSQNVFQGLCCSQAMLNSRQIETAVTYSVHTVWQYNPSQHIHPKLQRNCWISTQQQYFTYLFTHSVLYIKAC